MLYIITGIAKAGKSYLAKEIVEEYRIPRFSTDYIMVMLDAKKEENGIDIHASDRTVSTFVEPYLYNLVKTMVIAKEDYVIEGVHFNPDFAKKLTDEFGDDIRIIYLGYKDSSVSSKVEELYTHKEKISNQWIFDFMGQKTEDIVAYLIQESERVYQECKYNEVTYIEVTNIESQKEDIFRILGIK